MQSYIKKIGKLKMEWNSRPLSEADFYELCRRFKVTVVEMPLRTNGFYYCVKGRHFIAVDSKLSRLKKLFVMFHEFAHFLMHAPETNTTANFHGIGKKTRKEREADAFALCALIPKSWLTSRDLNDLMDEGFSSEYLEQRSALYRERGI